jgi:hypothetical protein
MSSLLRVFRANLARLPTPTKPHDTSRTETHSVRVRVRACTQRLLDTLDARPNKPVTELKNREDLAIVSSRLARYPQMAFAFVGLVCICLWFVRFFLLDLGLFVTLFVQTFALQSFQMSLSTYLILFSLCVIRRLNVQALQSVLHLTSPSSRDARVTVRVGCVLNEQETTQFEQENKNIQSTSDSQQQVKHTDTQDIKTKNEKTKQELCAALTASNDDDNDDEDEEKDEEKNQLDEDKQSEEEDADEDDGEENQKNKHEVDCVYVHPHVLLSLQLASGTILFPSFFSQNSFSF